MDYFQPNNKEMTLMDVHIYIFAYVFLKSFFFARGPNEYKWISNK